MVNNFTDCLEYSLGNREIMDIDLIKKIIPGCICVRKTDIEEDKAGVDYIATLRKGAEIKIDAKTRRKGCSKYWKHGEAELALETWSVVPTDNFAGKTGWTLDEKKEVDLILYTFDVSDWEKVYLLPYQHLRMAFRRHYYEWISMYKLKQEINNGWLSEAVFVPKSIILQSIKNICEI
jgi:hypothetical protein